LSGAIDNLEQAQKRAMATRPKAGGFPYLAETLRRAGVTRNLWWLPACQSLFLTKDGPAMIQGTPLVPGAVNIPPFNREALIKALRNDQAGESNVSGIFECLVARRSYPLRCRFRRAHRRLLRQQWRGVRRIVPRCHNRLGAAYLVANVRHPTVN
jgi:uncharacterized protein YbcV (DUF1398 family)